MVKFKCKNCGNVFIKFCDKLEDSLEIECINCHSHWVVTVFEDEDENKDQFIFPTLPYSDPPYPRPEIGDPWPPNKYKLWCTMNRARRSDW